jgi:hypothetical protein
MTETPILIEPSFADAIAIIVASQELPEQTRRHWTTSLRQIAKALDRPLEVIPARYSAIRNDLAQLHEVPAGLTTKTLQNHKSNTKSALLWLGREKGIPQHGAPLTAPWEALKAKAPDSLIRSRLSSFMRWCSVNDVTPPEVDEGVVDQFMSYRSRCGKPADAAFRRLLARAWNANVGTVSGWPARRLMEPPVKVAVEIKWGGVSRGSPAGRRSISSRTDPDPEEPDRTTYPTVEGFHDPNPSCGAPSCCPHGGEDRSADLHLKFNVRALGARRGGEGPGGLLAEERR